MTCLFSGFFVLLLVMRDVELPGLARMMSRVKMMTVRDMGVMRRRHVVFIFVMRGRLAMVGRCLLMVMGGLLVVLGGFAGVLHEALRGVPDQSSVPDP